MRWLGLAALGGVIAQGILGGMTVRMFQPPAVSAAHATLAQLFFSTVVAIAVFTSSWWSRELAEWKIRRIAARAFPGGLDRRGRVPAAHSGRGLPPQGFRNNSASDWRRYCYNTDLYDGGGPEEALFERAGAAQLRQTLAHPDRSATSAGWRGVLVAGFMRAQFPQPIPVMVALTVDSHGHRRPGAGGNV